MIREDVAQPRRAARRETPVTRSSSSRGSRVTGAPPTTTDRRCRKAARPRRACRPSRSRAATAAARGRRARRSASRPRVDVERRVVAGADERGPCRGLRRQRVAEERDRAGRVGAHLRVGEDALRAPTPYGPRGRRSVVGQDAHDDDRRGERRADRRPPGRRSGTRRARSPTRRTACPACRRGAGRGATARRRDASPRPSRARREGSRARPRAPRRPSPLRRAGRCDAEAADPRSASRRPRPRPRAAGSGPRSSVASICGTSRREATTSASARKPKDAPSVSPSSVFESLARYTTTNAVDESPVAPSRVATISEAREDPAGRAIPGAGGSRSRRSADSSSTPASTDTQPPQPPPHRARSPISRATSSRPAPATSHATSPSGIGPMLPSPKPPLFDGCLTSWT